MIKVEGYPHLYRDEKSGAIINCDSIGYEQYKRVKSNKKTQKEELDRMKSDIEEIKALLKELVNPN